MRRLLHLSMLFATLTQCNAQEFKSSLALTSGKSSFNMPFEFVDNRIFIDVQLNGKGPFKFILDTGGYAQVSLEAARAAMLRLDEQEQGTGVGQTSVTAWRTTIAEMRIGDIRLPDQEARAFSYADARHVFRSRRFDGVIGLPVFEHFVVKIDYENHMLTFTVPERFAYSGEGTLVASPSSVKTCSTKRHEYVVKSEEADVTIQLDPASTGLSGGYPVFTLAHSIESNPVARALQKKARQLKDSKLPGAYGIVLCDGSCDLMTRQGQDDWSSFHLNDVVRHFLANNTSISFVLTLTVLTDRSGYIGPRHLYIEQRLYQNHSYASLDPAVRQCVEKLHTFLPPPARTALNAKSDLEWRLGAGVPNHGDSFEGGHTLTDRTFKVSLRTIQELLGGRKDVKSFEDMHGLRRNPFLRNLDEGRLIASVEIEKGNPGEDDDWIIFTFGDADPAVSPYRPPDTAATGQ